MAIEVTVDDSSITVVHGQRGLLTVPGAHYRVELEEATTGHDCCDTTERFGVVLAAIDID